jgi:transcription-repair coupling factor (superfamily II helicase)
LIDRFGPVPREVNTLLLIMRIKAMAKRAGIARLDAGPKGATVQFHGDKYANPAGLVEYLQAERGSAKVRDNKLVLLRDWPTDNDRVRGAFTIARDLAERAKPAKR